MRKADIVVGGAYMAEAPGDSYNPPEVKVTVLEVGIERERWPGARRSGRKDGCRVRLEEPFYGHRDHLTGKRPVWEVGAEYEVATAKVSRPVGEADEEEVRERARRRADAARATELLLVLGLEERVPQRRFTDDGMTPGFHIGSGRVVEIDMEAALPWLRLLARGVGPVEWSLVMATPREADGEALMAMVEALRGIAAVDTLDFKEVRFRVLVPRAPSEFALGVACERAWTEVVDLVKSYGWRPPAEPAELAAVSDV
jgi:hypothetical protein